MKDSGKLTKSGALLKGVPTYKQIARSLAAFVSPMNRLGLWAIGIGVLISVAFLTPRYGFADKDECSLPTMQGQYMVSASGTVYPPAFGVTTPTASAAAAYSIYRGDGTGEDHVTFTVGGVDLHVPSPQPFTYTLKPDCTGTRSVDTVGPHFDIYVASDGSSLTEVATDPGFSVASFDRRVGEQDR